MHYPRRHFLAGAVALPGLTLADFANAGAAEADPFVPAFEEFRALWIAYREAEDRIPAAVNFEDDPAFDAYAEACASLERLSEITPTSIKGIALAARAALVADTESLIRGTPADIMEFQPEHSGRLDDPEGQTVNALRWGIIRAAEALEQRSI